MVKKTLEVKSKKRVAIGVIYVSALVFALGFGTYFFVRYNQVNDKYQAAIMTQEQKNNQYLAAIGKVMDLPKEEKPADLRLVKDKSKLGSAAVTKRFFDTANDNDIVVAYKNANMSIIYRPSTNKIVKTDNYNNYLAAVSPVAVGIIANAEQQANTEKLITDRLLNADIVGKNTPKVAQGSSFVVDATGANAKAAQELAEKLGLGVGQLPEGEAKVDGATLIVVMASQPSS